MKISYDQISIHRVPFHLRQKIRPASKMLFFLNWFGSADLFLLKSSLFSFQGYTFQAANGYLFGHARLCVCTEADFVGSVLLKESVNSSIGDDDKIYFFFTEGSQEQIAYPSQTKVSRVARVCKVRA